MLYTIDYPSFFFLNGIFLLFGVLVGFILANAMSDIKEEVKQTYKIMDEVVKILDDLERQEKDHEENQEV